MNRMATACFFAAALLTAGCSSSGTSSSAATAAADAANAKQYDLHGEVMGLDASGKVATIKHDEIKGFMGAMTMGYPVKDPAEFNSLKVGEKINAKVFVTSDSMWLGNIQQAAQ